MIKYIKKFIKRRRVGTKIILRYREVVIKEGYTSYWGNKVPAITKRVYLYDYYDFELRKTFYDELEMRALLKKINYLGMISQSSFWRGFLDHRKDNKEFADQYKKEVIYIMKTDDRSWVRL